MSRVNFKNEYFLSEKLDNGKIIVTVLKDERCYFGICLDNCKFITNSLGFVEYNFTEEVESQIELYCETNSINVDFFKSDLRNKTLTVLIGMLG